MNRFATTLLAAGVLLGASAAHAQTTSLAYWSFNDVSGSTVGAAERTALFEADGGVNRTSATMSTDASFSDGSTGGTVGIAFFAGTTTNATLPNGNSLTAGQAFALQGFTGLVNNGAFLQFSVPTVGFENIAVSFATRGTGSGFSNNQFSYSLNGTDFVDFGAAYNGTPITYFTQNYDLSTITGLNNSSAATFRITFDDASAVTGNNRIDNLQINGAPVGTVVIPETGSVALLAIGAPALLGALALRRKK